MCGGFTCSKNALTALNILYIVVAFILIGVAVYGQASSLVSDLPIISGILTCGVFLILVAILGLIGAVKHHQVILFFYMIILFLLFFIQFSIACACLGVNKNQQEELAKQGWSKVSDDIKLHVQDTFSCCGFDKEVNNTIRPTNDPMSHPVCHFDESCCVSSVLGGTKQCVCPPCMDKLQSTINYAFKLCGGIGLFFSFTELVAVIVAYRYRNQYHPLVKPPAANLPRNYIY